MKKETELTFEQKFRMGYGELSTGPFTVITLTDFLRNVKIEQLRGEGIDVGRNEGYHPAIQGGPVTDALFSRRVITMDRVETSMKEHLTRWFLSECPREVCEFSTDKEFETLIETKAREHLEAFGNPTLLVRLSSGQYLFTDHDDWVIMWNNDETELLERNAAVICLHKNRSNQLFLPFKS